MKLNKDLLSEIFLYCDYKTIKSLKKLFPDEVKKFINHNKDEINFLKIKRTHFSKKFQDLDKIVKNKLVDKIKLMIINSDLSNRDKEEFNKFDDYAIDKNRTTIKFINKELHFSLEKYSSNNKIIIYTKSFSIPPSFNKVFTKIYNLII